MNNELISRKALMEALVNAEEECEDAMCVPSWATALRVIRSQPTAYDIDAVVEQLEEKFLAEKNFKGKGCWFEAIEIVKSGGKV